MNEAGGGTLVKGITFIISGQAVVIKGIGRFSAHYLAVSFEELYPYAAGDVSLCALHIGS